MMYELIMTLHAWNKALFYVAMSRFNVIGSIDGSAK